MVSKTFSRNQKVLGDRLLLLKNRNKVSDATLVINGEKIAVNSYILAAACEYFYTRFLNKPKIEISFNDVDTSVFLQLIDYFYIGIIEISKKNAKELLKIANILILPMIIEKCTKILKNLLDTSTWISIWKLAQEENLDQLKTDALIYAKKNFEKVSLSDEFLKLEYVDLQELIKSDITAASEMVIYNAIKRWINYDNSSRKQNLINLLDFVNLNRLPCKFLESESNTFCNLDEICLRKFSEAKIISCEQSNTLVAVGSDNLERAKTIEIFDIVKKEWVEIDGVDFNETRFSATLLSDKLMLIGGYKSSKVEYYNLRTGKMEEVSEMRYDRYELSVVQYKGNVYAIGGNAGIEDPVSYVEKFDAKSRIWEDVTSLNTARRGSGAAVIGDEILVLGGYNNDGKILKSTEAFNFSTNTWNYRKELNRERYFPGVAVVGGYLYAVGGRGGWDSAERYDIKSDNWTLIKSTYINRQGLAAGNLMGKLIIAGGNKGIYDVLSSIEEYDHDKNEWKLVPSFKKPRMYFSLVEMPWDLAKEILLKIV